MTTMTSEQLMKQAGLWAARARAPYAPDHIRHRCWRMRRKYECAVSKRIGFRWVVPPPGEKSTPSDFST